MKNKKAARVGADHMQEGAVMVMDKIVLKRTASNKKPKRTSVVVSPNTYIRVYELAHDVNMTMEALVDKLLTEALDAVEIEEG